MLCAILSTVTVSPGSGAARPAVAIFSNCESHPSASNRSGRISVARNMAGAADRKALSPVLASHCASAESAFTNSKSDVPERRSVANIALFVVSVFTAMEAISTPRAAVPAETIALNMGDLGTGSSDKMRPLTIP